MNPLTILLDKPTNIGNVWAGWLVAAETDYASYWDMLLEPEDEPYDPLAGMIQVWNPIQITIPAETKVLAELKPIRLQAVRALAEEYETGVVSSQDGNCLPGRIAPRDTLGGFSVLTGTLLGDKNTDPRYEYQTLYHEVAKAIPVVDLEQYDWTEHLKALYQKWVKLLPAEQMVPATLAAGVVLGLVINMMMSHLTTVPSEGQIGEDSSIILRGDPDTTAEKPVSEQVNEIIEDLGDSPPDEWINEIVEKLYEGEIAVAKELLGQFQIRYPDYTGE
ncbi:hypothetical protein BGP_4461 [Beggiatoa sp. PS]|nr:hypothetical protein BGP_4461 [Beggiatoa sp. PS]